MKHNYPHIDPDNHPEGAPGDFFQGLEVPFEKTKDEAWAELEKKLAEKPAAKLRTIGSYRLATGVAASLLLMAGILSILRFYTKTVYCPAGQHLSYNLPDNSTVELNADSKMTFRPLWWRFSRKINFEGEGFFRVEKGRKFEVVSGIGRTEVLGTSFNIYSRDNEYKVACMTGKVRVISFTSEEVVLGPEYEASINKEGKIAVRKEANTSESPAWTGNMFNFKARPLVQVLNEIGRQYDVKIEIKTESEYYYTGYFSKNRPLEETLALVCKPFGLTFTRISDKEYEIFQN
jgi:ferric-dicitrate binding protein FerR (iron transport regulator)